MVKADDLIEENGNKTEYSHFELLKTEFEGLKILVNEIILTLRENGITKKVNIPTFEELIETEEKE